MRIGVPTEIKAYENRVALVPDGAAALIADGHEVFIQKGAGLGSGISDEEFVEAGASIIEDVDELWQTAEMIVKVKEPLPPEFGRCREGQVIFTYFHFAAAKELTEAMVASGASCFTYETLEIGETLPLLTPMSEVAGRMAIQCGAHCLERAQGGRGVLLGGVPGVSPGSVLILGGGVVGTNAAWMAAGLGADVTIMDINLERLRYLSDVMPANVTTVYSTPTAIRRRIRFADLVVGAVLIEGARAPTLVPRAYLKEMKEGAVIVEGRRCHRGRGHRPGRLCGDHPRHDPQGADLRRRRRGALRRGQHAGRRAAHLDLRPDQRHLALGPQARAPGRRGRRGRV